MARPLQYAAPRDRDDRARMTALGAHIRGERQRKQLSLEALAGSSGVSRSMLSAIERGEKVPTVLVLDRIAGALGVSVARLMDDQRDDRVVLLPVGEQQSVLELGWRRHIVSPVRAGLEMEFGRLVFDPQTDAGHFGAHQAGWTEYVVIESGVLDITLDGVAYRLNTGDALFYESDVDHAFANPTDEQTIAYIVMLGAGGRA